MYYIIILGEAQADVKEKSGQERYNAKITAVWSEEMGEGMKQMTEALTGLCVILEGGEKAFGKGNHEKRYFLRIFKPMVQMELD